MNHRQLAVLLGLALLSGCESLRDPSRLPSTRQPGAPVGPDQARADRADGPVGLEPLPSLHATINGPVRADGRALPTRVRPPAELAAQAPPETPRSAPRPVPTPSPTAPTDPAVSTAQGTPVAGGLPPLETDAARAPTPDDGLDDQGTPPGDPGDPAPPAAMPPLAGADAGVEPASTDPAPSDAGAEVQAEPPTAEPAPPDAPPSMDLPALPAAEATPAPAADASAEPSAEPAPQAAEPPPAGGPEPPGTAQSEPALPDPPGLPPLEIVEPPSGSSPAPVVLEATPTAEPTPAAEPSVEPVPAAAPPIDPPTPAPTTSSTNAPRDPAVRMASAIETKSEVSAVSGKLLGLNVARVGDRMITWSDLKRSIRDFRRAQGIDDHPLSEPEEQQIAKLVLDKLINRTLILEEARRSFKKPEQWKKLQAMADENWEKTELPPLLKKYKVDNKYELDVVLTKQGDSLEHLREVNRMEALSSEFLMMKLRSRFKPSLVETRKYYEENLSKFDLPAQVTWREVAIRLDAQTDRAQARRAAEAAFDRLRRNEDFARVARAVSQGPTADKGGLWETEPGTHAAPAVNAALVSLPLRQVSPILECPDALRIIRVEGRRPAGPAPFSEVQWKISRALFEQNAEQEITRFIEKLRGESLVRYMIQFDVPDRHADRG